MGPRMKKARDSAGSHTTVSLLQKRYKWQQVRIMRLAARARGRTAIWLRVPGTDSTSRGMERGRERSQNRPHTLLKPKPVSFFKQL